MHDHRRFLFTTFDGGGNVAPLMGPIERLLESGHEVRVMSDTSTRPEIERAGAEFVPWQTAPNRPCRSRETDAMDWAASSPAEALQGLVEHFLCGTALAYAQDVVAEFDRRPADLVVSSDMLLGAMLGCEARGQRFAMLSTSISMYDIPGVPPFGPGLAPARTAADSELHAQIAALKAASFDTGLQTLNSARAALGLRPLAHVLDQANAASVSFIGTARAFDFESTALPEKIRYVGPLLRDPAWAAPWTSPWPATDSRPLLLAGFSTSFQNHADCVQRVIDACAALPVRLLITLGGSLEPEELRAADNSRIVPSAPHGLVMREATAVITHGGHGTVMAALMNRLPQLVLPHGRDQADNAVRITERGAGLALQNTAATGEIRHALEVLLSDRSYQLAAKSLGDAVAAEVRSSALVTELEALAAQHGAGTPP